MVKFAAKRGAAPKALAFSRIWSSLFVPPFHGKIAGEGSAFGEKGAPPRFVPVSPTRTHRLRELSLERIHTCTDIGLVAMTVSGLAADDKVCVARKEAVAIGYSTQSLIMLLLQPIW